MTTHGHHLEMTTRSTIWDHIANSTTLPTAA
jgi:hypothetical protein